MAQMFGRALNIPFPRNRLPVLRSCIMLGHYLNPRNMKNVVIVWRDGRDIIVSYYYHSLFEFDIGGNTLLVKKSREDLKFNDYHDIRSNLPKFIEYVFTVKRSPRFSWADFVEKWYNREGVIYVKYEDLRVDAVKELQRVVKELTGKKLSKENAQSIVDEFSFKKQAGRKPGQEKRDSILRKGIVGDWKNHFTQAARERFDYYAGEYLIKLEYEQDRQWVTNEKTLS
ncbi:MAG: sulfotransferase domain-containing protein [Deltaproteobacteria bacterium]|nr:sulfotransferase domain-containing protein [Deltaproteobacteria bacterium]